MPKQAKKAKRPRKNAGTQRPAAIPLSRTVSRNVTSARAAPASKAAHTRSTCSITDPFCVHAKAARRPDGLSTASIPYQVKSALTLTTGATANGDAGRARMVIAPGFGFYGTALATYGVGTGQNTLAAAWSSLPNNGFVTNNAQEVRIVSMGVRIISITSATNSSGYVILGTLSAPVGGVVQDNGTTSYVETMTRTLAAGFETCWISKPTGSGAHNFRNSGITSTMSDFDWTGLSIEIVGGVNSTATLLIEIFTNVEIILGPNGATTGLSNLIPPATPSNPVALQAQRALHSNLPGLIDQGVSAVSTRIEKAGMSFVEDALSGAMMFLGL